MLSLALVLVVTSAAEVGALEVGRQGDFGPLHVRLACAEVTNVYLENEFPDVYREPSMTMALENSGEDAAHIVCRAEVSDLRGNRRAVRPAEQQVTVAPKERTRVVFTTDPARGTFALRVTLRGEGALASLPERDFVSGFAVTPPVDVDVAPDSFFRIEGDRLWRPYTVEVCRRLGAKAAWVAVTSDTTREIFDGWAAVARQRGIALMPLCGPDRFAEPAGGSLAARGATEQASTGAPAVWNRCGFVLAPNELRPSILGIAAGGTLESYTLCGGVAQLDYVLAHAAQTDMAKLAELGFTLGEAGSPGPYPDTYFLRTLDRCAEIARKHGTRVSLQGFVPPVRNVADAGALVATYTMAALSGFHAVSVQGPGGISEGPGNERFVLGQVHAVLAHFLRDRVSVADVWPQHTLLVGCVFARPEARVQDEARAAALGVRDAVAGRAAGENVKVAVIFSRARRSGGTAEIVIPRGGDLAAYDVSGNPIGVRREDALILPFGDEPVFVTTRGADTSEFAGKLRRAQVRGLELFHCAVMPLHRPALDLPEVRILLDNSDTQDLEGLVRAESEGWESASEGGTRFVLKPGETTELKVAMKKTARRNDGVYPFRIDIETRFGVQSHELMLSSAIVWPVAGRVDGKVDEWERMAGLALVPAARAGGTSVGGAAAWQGTMWAGYDRDALYVACKLEGVDAASAWNGDASPAGIRAALSGFALQLALGAGARSADCPHTPDDPWFWKGVIRDTDHLFLIAPRTGGEARVLTLHDPQMVWGETLLRGAASPEGAQCVIARANGGVVIEAKIPARALARFDKDMGTMRVGLTVHAKGRTLQLGESYGIPSHLASGGSFLPWSRSDLLPNLITWGVVK